MHIFQNQKKKLVKIAGSDYAPKVNANTASIQEVQNILTTSQNINSTWQFKSKNIEKQRIH